MNYRVKLYDRIGSSPAIKTFPEAVVVAWNKKINTFGQASFWLPARSPSFQISDLKKYTRIRIERRKRDGSGGWEVVWYGYIESHKRIDANRIGVICQGPLKMFRKRFCTLDEVFDGEGSAEAFGLLSAANSTGALGFTEGTGGVTTTKSVKAQGRIDMLRALELLAQAHNAEFEITDAGVLRFVPLLGSDLSAAVTLRFKRDGSPGNNMSDTFEGEEGEGMVNKLHVSSTEGGTYTAEDGDSQTEFGILEGYKQMNEAQDAGTLESMGDSLVTQLANPLSDFQALPLLAQKTHDPMTNLEQVTGYQYGAFGLGDLVKAEIVTENQEISEARRIAEISVNVDEKENELVSCTLSKPGVFITSSYLSGDEIAEIRRNLRDIEGVLA